MSNDSAVNGHPNPFTLEPLDAPDTFRPLSAREVTELREQQEREINKRRHIAHRKEGNMKTSRDGAQYVRQQKGHSWLIGWLLIGPLTMFIVPIYWSVSPNHYWHL